MPLKHPAAYIFFEEEEHKGTLGPSLIRHYAGRPLTWNAVDARFKFVLPSES